MVFWPDYEATKQQEKWEERRFRPAGLSRYGGSVEKNCGVSQARVDLHARRRRESVMYVQKGGVKLSVVNGSGKEAVVAMFGPTDFFGEGCMAGQTIRMGTATAVTPTTILVIEKNELLRVLHTEQELSDHFIRYMLAHNIRVEEDLVDQLFNSSEKRLARTLLLLARYGKQDQPIRMSAEGLARDPGKHGWDDTFAREFLHEQIQKTGLHRIQRQNQGQQVVVDGCLARVRRSAPLRQAGTRLWYLTEKFVRSHAPPRCVFLGLSCGDFFRKSWIHRKSNVLAENIAPRETIDGD